MLKKKAGISISRQVREETPKGGRGFVSRWRLLLTASAFLEFGFSF